MKTIHRTLFLALAVIIGRPASAQNMIVSEPKTHWFEAEGINYYHVTDCTPGTRVAFYSQTWGGKLLRTDVTDITGSLTFNADKKFAPAFALNTQEKNAAGICGTGMVGFIEAREFLIDNIESKISSGFISIGWIGAVEIDQPINFEVLKSTDGINFTTMATYNTSNSNLQQHFSFTETYVPNAVYRLRVWDKVQGGRYTTKSISGINSSTKNFLVYPTVITDQIHIAAQTPAKYNVINSLGEIVRTGSLTAGDNTFGLKFLSAGQYIVELLTKDLKSVTKIIKQ